MIYPTAPPLLVDLPANVIAFITSLLPIWGPYAAMLVGGALAIAFVRHLWTLVIGKYGVPFPIAGAASDDDDDDDDDERVLVPSAYTNASVRAKTLNKMYNPDWTQSRKDSWF